MEKIDSEQNPLSQNRSTTPAKKTDWIIAGTILFFSTTCVLIVLVGGYLIFLTLNSPKTASSFSPTATRLPNPQLHPGRMIALNTFEYQNKMNVAWDLGHIDDKLVTLNQMIMNGKYIWKATAKDGVFFHSVPAAPYFDIPDDYYQVSVDAQMVNGPADSEYGIIFDYVDNDNFWVWEVNDDGDSYLETMVEGDWSNTSNKFLAPILKNGTNTLTMKVSPDVLYFYVNGALASSYHNPTPGTTSFMKSKRNGLCIDLSKGDQVTINFDNYIVSHPDRFDQ